MEDALQIAAGHVALALEAISMLVILVGGVEALYRTLWQMFRRHMAHGMRRAAWLSMARWLVLALEFMLAADIVRTLIDPDWSALGKLAATAAIRTFLNYFLERDLQEAEASMEVT